MNYIIVTFPLKGLGTGRLLDRQTRFNLALGRRAHECARLRIQQPGRLPAVRISCRPRRASESDVGRTTENERTPEPASSSTSYGERKITVLTNFRPTYEIFHTKIDRNLFGRTLRRIRLENFLHNSFPTNLMS